ncbi:MAG: hypothetical protein H6810_09450 [Phycisphaeraceae bacterium]|nr:MAG: hypothetical protein H6810_09450 [Phycisphaeraceae bacterium]
MAPVLAPLCLCLVSLASAAEPALPPGLTKPQPKNEPSEPALPAGLGGRSDEPALPTGLGGKPESPADENESPLADSHLTLDLSGFAEGRLGTRIQNDPYEKTASIGEARLQLEADLASPDWTARLVTDVLYDPVVDRHEPHLETGEGALDLREAWLAFSVFDNADVKVGRQIMTWGTGDLLFINDLFPKDWNAFFIGRDEEYLKAPNDAVRVSLFTDLANLDVAYVPNFDADRFIDGQRISYYNATLGRRAGRDAVVQTDRPNRWFRDDEIHYRLYRSIGAVEFAAYGYHGFWKSPGGQTPGGLAAFPGLNVYGASIRGPLLGGIANGEFGFYDSADDRGGRDPLINNSELRYLLGYEHELATDLTLGVQYYVEQMLQHDGYLASLPAGVPARDAFRHVLTARLTWRSMNQNLIWSCFAYYSPSDRDAYLRPSVTYKIDDHWTASVGGNVFVGAEQHTFFGQFSRDTNVYASLRYGF